MSNSVPPEKILELTHRLQAVEDGRCAVGKKEKRIRAEAAALGVSWNTLVALTKSLHHFPIDEQTKMKIIEIYQPIFNMMQIVEEKKP